MTGLESILLGLFVIAAGLGILGWWAVEWASHGRSALMAFGASHILAELVAASVLLMGGIAVLLGGPDSNVLVPAGLGMLLYATINAWGRVGNEYPVLRMVMAAEAIGISAILVILLLGI
jgi:hypothetical protein